MTTFLVPVDGSPSNRQLLDYVIAQSRLLPSVHTILIYVNIPLHSLHVSELIDYATVEDVYREQAAGALDPAEKILRDAGLTDVTRVVREGHPATEIVEEARSRCVDAIVMGTHGRGAIMSTLMGSVSKEVLEHTPCPLVVIRTPEA